MKCPNRTCATVADSGIQLPISLIFNVHMYSEMADSPKKWPILQIWQEELATLKSPSGKTFSVESYTKTKLHFIHVPLTTAKYWTKNQSLRTAH